MKLIYLILDLGSINQEKINQLEHLLSYPQIYALQLWNTQKNADKLILTENIKHVCNQHHIPIFIQEDWETALRFDLDGVHFDEIPYNILEIKEEIQSLKIGFTTGNDFQKVKQAELLNADYISFCSLFPSQTANSCELVKHKSIEESKKYFSGKVFLAGGITPEKSSELAALSYDGISIVSGILESPDPEFELNKYIKSYQF